MHNDCVYSNPSNGEDAYYLTRNGYNFHVFNPVPEEVDIRDIAWSLSHLCRFNGHCSRFYSVAEHSIGVCNFLAPEYKLMGLLHDAGEAYVCDVPRPVKLFIPEFKEIENRILKVIFDKYGIEYPINDIVIACDNLMLDIEMKSIMYGAHGDRTYYCYLNAIKSADEVVTPEDTYKKFLSMFNNLYEKR